MPGANDPDNRRMMRFGGLLPEEEDVKKTTTKLGNLRSSSLALSYGDTRILSAGKDHLVVMRQYFDKAAILVLNRSGDSKKLEIVLPEYVKGSLLKSNFGSQLAINGSKLTVDLNPLSFEIATN